MVLTNLTLRCQLGKYGRYSTNLGQYPGANTLSLHGSEGDLLRMHPTVKPTAMVADAILDCSERGGIVLDAFLGSGTTLLAAERTGRVCHGLELDPLYVDVAVRRWKALTGDAAVHALSGRRFGEVEAAQPVPRDYERENTQQIIGIDTNRTLQSEANGEQALQPQKAPRQRLEPPRPAASHERTTRGNSANA